jgi:hypothetical protein
MVDKMDMQRLLASSKSPWPVGPYHPGILQKVFKRRLQPAADRAVEGRQDQRRTRQQEPGIDLLAFGYVAAFVSIVELFLRGVMCLLGIVVGHPRAPISAASFVA